MGTVSAEINFDIICSKCGNDLSHDVTEKRGKTIIISEFCPNCVKDLNDQYNFDTSERDSIITDLEKQIEQLQIEKEALEISLTFTNIQNHR